MREQLDAIAKTIEVLHEKRHSVEESILPGFNKAVDTAEDFFIECYKKAKEHCQQQGIQFITSSRVTALTNQLSLSRPWG